MHILLTNDDGPPDAKHSPYLNAFVAALRAPPHNHTVTVVIPSQQRSWIGKAHLLPASAYPTSNPIQSSFSNANTSANAPISDPSLDASTHPPHYTMTRTHIATSAEPPPATADHSDTDTWVLLPSTPATCSQIALHHLPALFPNSALPPIDPRPLRSEPRP
ncbi:hypothetical protein MRB53_040240 [Persea americana]|nr:hypothetical protein MRB53_040240 [Persea americana]